MTLRIVSLLLCSLLLAFEGQVSAQSRQTPRLEIRLAEKSPGRELVPARVAKEADVKGKLYLHKETIVTEDDVADVRVARYQPDEWYIEMAKKAGVKAAYGEPGFEVQLTFTSSAAARMRRATQSHIGRPMAILVNGVVISAATVNSQIDDHARIVSGILGMSKQDADRIASAVKNR